MVVTQLPNIGTVARTKPTGWIAPGVVRSEWTKLRTVRSTYWTLLAAAVAMIGVSVIVCAILVAQYANMSIKDKASFDPVTLSLAGGFLAQLAIAVLGVLVITSEYSSGMIRATFAAVPQRVTVLAAKATVFAGVTFVVSTVACLWSRSSSVRRSSRTKASACRLAHPARCGLSSATGCTSPLSGCSRSVSAPSSAARRGP